MLRNLHCLFIVVDIKYSHQWTCYVQNQNLGSVYMYIYCWKFFIYSCLGVNTKFTTWGMLICDLHPPSELKNLQHNTTFNCISIVVDIFFIYGARGYWKVIKYYR